MSSRKTSPAPWTGLLSFAFVFPIVISVFVLVIFILGIYFGVNLVNPNPAPDYPRAYSTFAQYQNTGVLAVYVGLVPLLSLLYSFLSVFLHLVSRMSPVHVITSSIIFMLGWAAMLAVWVPCEIYGGYEASAPGCPNRAWGEVTMWRDDPAFFTAGFRRIYLVGVVWVLYFVYMVFGCIARHRERMERKRNAAKFDAELQAMQK